MASTTTASPQRWFGFPEIVDERAARTVAAFVVALSAAYVVTGWWPLLAALAYGFVARVAAGPRYSPFGLAATRVVVPRLPGRPRLTAGAPKRFAQSIGATLSLTAVALLIVLDTSTASRVTVGLITAAATLESALGYCLGCVIFARLMRLGVIPERVCEACADISRRTVAA